MAVISIKYTADVQYTTSGSQWQREYGAAEHDNATSRALRWRYGINANIETRVR